MSNLITGLFDTQTAAQSAVEQLKQLGYTSSEISVIAKDEAAAESMPASPNTHVQEGHSPTATAGGTVGAVLGGLLAIGAVAIPGVGLIAAGALAALFVGGGVLTGSAIGWLVDQGIPEDVAPYYERGLHNGGVIVTVAAHPGDDSVVAEILHSGAVAHSGTAVGSYVAPHYASRHIDLSPPAAPTAVLVMPAPSSPAPAEHPITYSKTNEHPPIAIPILEEIRSEQQEAIEHERAIRRDALLANPLSHDAAAGKKPDTEAFTGLDNQP